MQFGGTRKTVHLCANRLQLSVLMSRIWSGRLVNQQIQILFVKNSFALTASTSNKHNCSLLTFALRYQEPTGVNQQLIATKTWKPSFSGSMLILGRVCKCGTSLSFFSGLGAPKTLKTRLFSIKTHVGFLLYRQCPIICTGRTTNIKTRQGQHVFPTLLRSTTDLQSCCYEVSKGNPLDDIRSLGQVTASNGCQTATNLL